MMLDYVATSCLFSLGLEVVFDRNLPHFAVFLAVCARCSLHIIQYLVTCDEPSVKLPYCVASVIAQACLPDQVTEDRELLDFFLHFIKCVFF